MRRGEERRREERKGEVRRGKERMRGGEGRRWKELKQKRELE